MGKTPGTAEATFTKKQYTVTVETDGNGTATANSSSAAKGETVTLKANPKPGYRFKEWVVDDVATPITITDVTDSTTTFEMPASDVYIYATFEADGGDEDEKYDITVISGKATIGAGTIVTESEAGVTITITADAPASGKVFDKWVIKSDTQPVLAKATDATTTFTMPEGAVTVEATYNDAPVTPGDDPSQPGDDPAQPGDDPTQPGEQNPETGAPVDPAPQTGDNSNLFLWIALLFVSSMGVIATTILGKKKRYNR